MFCSEKKKLYENYLRKYAIFHEWSTFAKAIEQNGYDIVEAKYCYTDSFQRITFFLVFI